ncbi:MAG: hypothetical protein V4526_02540 [Patescibacteria group bacterium]
MDTKDIKPTGGSGAAAPKHIGLPKINFSKFWSLLGRDPHVDWVIMFAVCILIGAGVIGWGVYRFFTIDSNDAALGVVGTEVQATPINPAQFTNLSKEFESKRLKTVELESGQVYTPDPSVI